MKKKIFYLILLMFTLYINVSCNKNDDILTVKPIIDINEFYDIDYKEAENKLGKLNYVEPEDSLVSDKNIYTTQDGKIELIFIKSNEQLSVISIYADKNKPFVLNEEDDIFKMLNISKGKNVIYAKFYPIFFNVDNNGYIKEVRLESEHREYPKSGTKLSIFFNYN